MEILQWLSTALQAMTAGLFAMLPGMVFWLTVLGFYMLIQWIGHHFLSRTPTESPW
jgi:hypothetical protein